ncbi:MAG TPA: hypothetical protein PK883_06740, partial [Anaerolineaceae bacterium]|nr:hypothetical protein [Anaerolineaceae bacterium]
MRSKFIVLAVFIIALALFAGFKITPVSAANDIDRALCLPGGDDITALDCLRAGPSARLDELAATGFALPQPQLFASRTPYALASVPYSYALV